MNYKLTSLYFGSMYDISLFLVVFQFLWVFRDTVCLKGKIYVSDQFIVLIYQFYLALSSFLGQSFMIVYVKGIGIN